MIPKIIYTIWIGEIPLPEKYQGWVNTHDIPGYEHQLITLDNCVRGIRYLEEAIVAKKWIKVSDYLRMFYLWSKGGIYLDCDMEIIKPLDDLLDNALFVGRENEKVIANSVIGAERSHPILKKYLEMVDSNFRGSGDMVFEPAERLFTDLINGVYSKPNNATRQPDLWDQVRIYPDEYFFPYNEKTGITGITSETHAIHHFERSWKDNL